MKNDGGSAFPKGFPDARDTGMSLRDWFAGQALHAILSNPESVVLSPEEYSKEAYQQSDAMLAEREKGNDSSS